MKIFNNIFLTILFLFISTNPIQAQEKVSYIDVDYILTSTIAGKSLLYKLKEEENLKINIFKSKDENHR